MAAVLLVVDVQRALVDALAPDRRSGFVATLRSIIDAARRHGLAVVYVRHYDDELLLNSPGWQVAPEIEPAAHDRIVDKRFRDAFRETDLADVLAALSADSIIVCGMQTEYCVDATMREAERRGYKVTLVADGHATYDAGAVTEVQIRDHVHRVAAGSVADIVPADRLFSQALLR